MWCAIYISIDIFRMEWAYSAGTRIGFPVKRFNKVEHLSINRNCLSYYFYRLRFVYIAQDASLSAQPAAMPGIKMYIYISLYLSHRHVGLYVGRKSGKATLAISHRLVIAIIFFQLSGSSVIWSPQTPTVVSFATFWFHNFSYFLDGRLPGLIQFLAIELWTVFMALIMATAFEVTLLEVALNLIHLRLKAAKSYFYEPLCLMKI